MGTKKEDKWFIRRLQVRSRTKRSAGFLWRITKIGTGFLLLLGGAILAVPGVPGPGILVAFLGLVLLSAEFIWAQRLRKKVQGQVRRVLPKKWKQRFAD